MRPDMLGPHFSQMILTAAVLNMILDLICEKQVCQVLNPDHAIIWYNKSNSESCPDGTWKRRKG